MTKPKWVLPLKLNSVNRSLAYICIADYSITGGDLGMPILDPESSENEPAP